MAKLRVHQLAKELGIDSKLILREAEKHGIQLKNHMSALGDSDEMMLRAFLPQAPVKEEKPAAKAPPPPPPPPPPRPKQPDPAPAPAPEGDEHPGIAAPRPRTTARPSTETARPAAPGVSATPGITARPGGARPAAGVTARPGGSAPVEDAPAEETPQRPATRTVRAAPPGVVARPGGAVPEEPAPPAEETPAAEQPPARKGPAELRVAAPRAGTEVRSATAQPVRPDTVVRRPITSTRRQATILGRKELPPQRPAPGGVRSGEGGSGLVVTRREGGKRTFVNTGRRGGPHQRGTAGGAHGNTGRRGPGGRTRRGPGGPRREEVNAIEVTPDELSIELPITVKGLSEKLKLKAPRIIKDLFLQHQKMVKINDPLDKETIELLGLEYECEITVTEKVDVETRVLDELESRWEGSDDDEKVARAPIVAFLGHVDHGKTSLLDKIRDTGIAAREHGGITQHIGSSRVELPSGQAIVLLDTPGHRAFTEMRARGAQVTDIVVLVVAADDGVMPQTKEAIAHARAAGTPIVVALNKVDRASANVQKVRQELAVEGLQDEAWGGDTQICEVSAITGQGVDSLLESLLLESELLELKANPTRPALATVIEAEQSRGEGNLARLVVNDGTLKRGDFFVCGTAYGRIRAIKGPLNKLMKEAGPAWPVEITGLNELPSAGDKLYVLDSLDEAKEIASRRMQLAREKEIAKASHVSLESLFDKLKGNTLKIILKTDVTGSKQVLQKEIMDLAHPEIRPEIIHAAVGGITETDVTLADASDAIILGFHVNAPAGSRRLAEQRGVEIRTYQIIYKLIEELTEALEGRLAPEEKEVTLGEIEVKATWKVSRLGTIAGCYVTSGLVRRDSRVRVSRDDIVIHDEGRISSLKRVKDDVKEVKQDFECGLLIQNFDKIQVGDVITAYEIQQIKRTFDSPPLASATPAPAEAE